MNSRASSNTALLALAGLLLCASGGAQERRPAPGRHGCSSSQPFEPTYLSGFAWQPMWPDTANCENVHCRCDSSILNALEPAVPELAAEVAIELIEGRGLCRLIEAPSAANGFRIVLEFDDNPQGGPAWYEVLITLEAGRQAQYTEVADAGAEDTIREIFEHHLGPAKVLGLPTGPGDAAHTFYDFAAARAVRVPDFGAAKEQRLEHVLDPRAPRVEARDQLWTEVSSTSTPEHASRAARGPCSGSIDCRATARPSRSRC